MRARIKPSDIEVPKDDPFRHDALDRKESVEILARLIGSVDGAGVFGIDADWGNGKTTFLRMLHRFLENDDVPVVSFNAWESDYVSDPFTAIVTELTDSLDGRADESDTETRGRIGNGLERAKAVMKTRWPAMLRSLATEVPVAGEALGEMVDGFADSHVDQRVSGYREARKSVAEFRNALEEVARSVSEDREHPLLVMTIDELDRCRPSYAVELLEVAKHLFSVDGVVFVIAVNRAELAHSIQALYGSGFDARGYLGRFFDVDFRLPDPDRSRFIKETIGTVGIRSYLERTPDPDGRSELSTLESMLESFFGEPVVSLRTAARAIHHLGMVYAALVDKRLVLGTTMATLVILRTLDRALYYRFVDGRASDAEVVDGLVERLGEDACARHEGEMAAFEAWVIASQWGRDRGDGYVFDDGSAAATRSSCTGPAQRVAAQFVVIVEVLVTQRQRVHALRQQRAHVMLDARRVAVIDETPGQPFRQPDALVHFAKQQTAAVGTHVPTVEAARYPAPSKRVKIKLIVATLHVQGCFLFVWRKRFIAQPLCHRKQPSSTPSVRYPG